MPASCLLGQERRRMRARGREAPAMLFSTFERLIPPTRPPEQPEPPATLLGF